MKRVALVALLGLLGGCLTGRVPSHLAPPEAAPDPQDRLAFDDRAGMLRAMIGRDPMGRGAAGVDRQAVAALPGTEAYLELLDAADRLGPDADRALRSLRALEAAHRGTPLVALSRGIRLREIEGTVGAQANLAGGSEGELLLLLTPLSATEKATGLPRRPLAWLAGDLPLQAALLTAGDRWALSGWLDGPDMDLQPVADALSGAPFDTLRGTPVARLLLARVSGAEGPTDTGLADLDRASRALLTEAVFDDKAGRTRSAELWARLGEELGSDEPRDALLSRAAAQLRDASSEDVAAGGALLAIQARRVWGTCPNAPCMGLDRVDGMGAAARWDARLGVFSRRLQLAALHDAIDGIGVARGTVRYPAAAADLADALIGTGAVPPEARIVRQRSPDASTWLTLGRSVGVESCTTWEEARGALRAWAAVRAERALEQEQDPEVRQALQRIRSLAP